MRRAIVVVTVMMAAVLIGSSAVAYAKQSDNKKTSPETTSQKATSPETTSQGAAEPITTEATAWGKYHWQRTANPFTLKLGDNVTSNWKGYLGTTSKDWTSSNVLDTMVIPGTSSARKCAARTGRVEICNATYGNNGWLGIASIWASGDHITQGTTKMNDSYFNTAKYNPPAWRNLVMCQEVGHTLGLGHDNETFTDPNKGTCMDYTNDPSGTSGTNGTSSNEHPNADDYKLLESIYLHKDSSTTLGQTTTDDKVPGDGPPAWGKEKSRSKDGQFSVFEKDLGKDKNGNDNKKITHVFWTEERAKEHRGKHDDHQDEDQDEDHEHQEAQPEQQQQDY